MTEPHRDQCAAENFESQISTRPSNMRQALIVSGHPLFSAGLCSLLEQRRAANMPGYANIGVAATVQTVDDAIIALNTLMPDLVIVDYDINEVSRMEFLARFVESDTSVRVVLVSLDESGSVMVYDRHKLVLSESDDWLNTITALVSDIGAKQKTQTDKGDLE